MVELYRRYLGGHTFYLLAQWLNQAGHAPNRASRWHPNTVRNVLDNPTHAGYVTYLGKVGPGAHDPIIDEPT